jgi:hypothetical protein
LQPKKNKILCKFRISEKKRGVNPLRGNFFIKINTEQLASKPKSIDKAMTKDNFPLINTRNDASIRTPKASKCIGTRKMTINDRYQSKDDITQSTLLPNTKNFNSLKISNNNICNSNNTYTQTPESKKVSKNLVNYSQPKRRFSVFPNFFHNIDKNSLKVIRLSKINDLKDSINALDEINKNNDSYNPNNDDNDLDFNPIKLDLNNNKENDNNQSDNDKIVIGSKFHNFDLHPDSEAKNIFYSKLNTYFRKMSEKPPIKKKKINLSKIDLKLKGFHEKRIKDFKRLIDSTTKEVIGIKINCANWVNELREKYPDMYKGYRFDTNDDNLGD